MFPRNSALRTGVALTNPVTGAGSVRETSMASSKGLLRETVRNHPLIVASTAATAGVLLGGLFSMQLLDTSQPRVGSTAAPLAATEIKAEKPTPETTGSASAGERVVSLECERQTWPYLSRDCMEEYRRTHRAPRVVSTDKLDKQTVESIEQPSTDGAKPLELAAPAVWAPAVVSTEPLVPSSVAAVAPAAMPAVNDSAGVGSAPASTPAVASSAPQALAAQDLPAQSSPTQTSPPQTTAKNEEKEKHAVKKARRKPKSERRAPPKPDVDDDSDDGTVAAAYSDDRDDEPVAVERRERPRIVRRAPGRGYDGPEEDDGGRRRVIVINRDRGGLFGNLFGGF